MEDLEIPDRVVFMNIKTGSVFFDCNPAEARVAQKSVKRFRLSVASGDYEKRAEEIQQQLREGIKKIDDVSVKHIVISTGGQLTLNALNQGVAQLEQDGYEIDTVFLSPMRHADVRNFGTSIYDEPNELYQEITGVKKIIWDMDIYVTREVPMDTVLLCGSIYDGEKTEELVWGKIEVISEL